jgi:hypothetical protein
MKDRGMGRRGRRRKQLLDDLKGKWSYWIFKKEALDHTLWRTRFGRGHGPVARHTMDIMMAIIRRPWVLKVSVVQIFILRRLVKTQILLGFIYLFIFAVAPQPKSGLGRLFWGSRTHTDTHTRYGSSERAIRALQRPLPSHHTTNIRDEHPYRRRDSNLRPQQASGHRPTP